LLQRFWITFERQQSPTWANLDCGVTAYSLGDAVSILRSAVFPHRKMPEIRSVIVDVDIRTLDKGHVLSNMGVPVWRGVRYPKGFAFPDDR
jgi:hypothetical protein